MPVRKTNPENKPSGYIDDLQYIKSFLLPEWLELFEKKNKDYGDDSGKLGIAGGFVDIWRKSLKLKRALWDNKPLRGEQPPEIVMDMIGHCFLLLIDLNAERERKVRPITTVHLPDTKWAIESVQDNQ